MLSYDKNIVGWWGRAPQQKEDPVELEDIARRMSQLRKSSSAATQNHETNLRPRSHAAGRQSCIAGPRKSHVLNN